MVYKKAQPEAINSPGKILIVEDEVMTRNILSKIITNYLGCDVNIAVSVREAMSFLESVKFDLIIAGLSDKAPLILEMAGKIRDKGYRIPIVVVTGDCPDSDLQRMKSSGIDKIVYKPLKLSPFLEAVAGAFIENKRVLDYA